MLSHSLLFYVAESFLFVNNVGLCFIMDGDLIEKGGRKCGSYISYISDPKPCVATTSSTSFCNTTNYIYLYPITRATA